MENFFETIIEIIWVILCTIAKLLFLIFMAGYWAITTILGITPEDKANDWYDSFIEESLNDDDVDEIYDEFAEYAKELNPDLKEQIKELCDFYDGKSVEIEEKTSDNIDVESDSFFDENGDIIFQGTYRYMIKNVTTDKDSYCIVIISYIDSDDSKYDGIYDIEICRKADEEKLSDTFPKVHKKYSSLESFNIGVNIAESK